MSALTRISSLWKKKSNRRLYRRMETSAQVFMYDFEGNQGVQGHLVSWSLGGIALYAPITSPESTMVKVCFTIPGWLESSVTLSGQILRSDRVDHQENFFVVMFTQPEEADRLRLREALFNPRREFEYQKLPVLDAPQGLEP